MKPVTNLIGKRFGRLTVTAATKNSQNRTAWVVHCDCGATKIVCTGVLNNGTTESCRCFQKEVAREVCRDLGFNTLGKKTKHGHFTFKHRSPTYQSWSAMRDRCLNPNHVGYKHYGGRGISICDRWRGEDGFENFLADMSYRPKGKSLDRVDVNGNYHPENCRWATAKQQAKNRRPFRAIQNFSVAELRAEIKRRTKNE